MKSIVTSLCLMTALSTCYVQGMGEEEYFETLARLNPGLADAVHIGQGKAGGFLAEREATKKAQEESLSFLEEASTVTAAAQENARRLNLLRLHQIKLSASQSAYNEADKYFIFFQSQLYHLLSF